MSIHHTSPPRSLKLFSGSKVNITPAEAKLCLNSPGKTSRLKATHSVNVLTFLENKLETYSIEVPASAKVHNIKEKLAEKMRVSPGNLRLALNGVEYPDSKDLPSNFSTFSILCVLDKDPFSVFATLIHRLMDCLSDSTLPAQPRTKISTCLERARNKASLIRLMIFLEKNINRNSFVSKWKSVRRLWLGAVTLSGSIQALMTWVAFLAENLCKSAYPDRVENFLNWRHSVTRFILSDEYGRFAGIQFCILLVQNAMKKSAFANEWVSWRMQWQSDALGIVYGDLFSLSYLFNVLAGNIDLRHIKVDDALACEGMNCAESWLSGWSASIESLSKSRSRNALSAFAKHFLALLNVLDSSAFISNWESTWDIWKPILEEVSCSDGDDLNSHVDISSTEEEANEEIENQVIHVESRLLEELSSALFSTKLEVSPDEEHFDYFEEGNQPEGEIEFFHIA